MPLRVQRIVVRRVDNVGDIVIALPVLDALRSNFPQAQLTLMVKESHRVLCETLADSFIDPVPLDEFPAVARRYDLAFNIDYFGPGNRDRQLLRRSVSLYEFCFWTESSICLTLRQPSVTRQAGPFLLARTTIPCEVRAR